MAHVPQALANAMQDRYRLERELGPGEWPRSIWLRTSGMAARWRSRCCIPSSLLSSGADRFLSEIKTTAALQHPHILPLFDWVTQTGICSM